MSLSTLSIQSYTDAVLLIRRAIYTVAAGDAIQSKAVALTILLDALEYLANPEQYKELN